MKPRVARYKRLRRDPTIDPTQLDQCSDSELVEVARRMGYPNASRAQHRDDLLLLLIGEADPPARDELEEVRAKTYSKVRGQALLLTTLNCDANCPLCPHDKVVACYAENRDVVDAVVLEDP